MGRNDITGSMMTGSLGGRAARFIGKNPLAADFIERVALQR
jgi:hypothetical protein